MVKLTKSEFNILLDGLYMKIEGLETWLREMKEFKPYEKDAIKAAKKDIGVWKTLVTKIEKGM